MKKTTWGLTIAGAVAVAGAAIAVPAQAATDEPKDGWRASISAEQRQCLRDNGVGAQKDKTKQERVANLKSAAQNCGVALPEGIGGGQGRLASLTEEQRTCLMDSGIAKPQGIPTAADVQKMRDAASTCGVQVPERLGKLADRVASLTDEQRQCLVDNGVGTMQGKAPKERLANLRNTAQTCGVTPGA